MKVYKWIWIYHAFIGIGAMGGGIGPLLDPSGKSMGLSSEMLVKAPFDDFLIPGLILFFFIGLGNIICAILAYKRMKFQAYFTGFMGIGLVIWIVVQCYMLWAINILHVIYFIFGLVGIWFAFILALKQNLFPLNYFLIVKKHD